MTTETDALNIVSTNRFILSLAFRILAAHEVIGARAERRQFVLTEHDYCPLAGDRQPLPAPHPLREAGER